MIEKLTVKNYLLLKNVEIDFSLGFNVITGETGAGKSILIDALSLLMGERADYSIINKNKEKMIVEALIRISENNKHEVDKMLAENQIESMEKGYLITRRELYSKAYSRSFINDTPVGLNILSELGAKLIDIHSQNEHQSLLRKEIHLQLLDAYLNKTVGKRYRDKLDEYKQGYIALQNTIKELEHLRQKKSELDGKRSFLEFQLKEIREINPVLEEDDELENELNTGQNIENIKLGLSSAYLNLYDDAGAAIERIKAAEKELSKISEYNTDIQKILNDIRESSSILNESGRLLQSLIDNLSFDPDRVEQIRERLYKLQYLKKKYGGTVEEAIKLRERTEGELSLFENYDEKVIEAERKTQALREDLFKKAKDISETRKEKSKILESETAKILKEVGLEAAEFKVNFKNNIEENQTNLTVKNKTELIKLSETGIDETEFLVKTNKGDDFSSLRKTASGGEVSRIMLSLKSVLADADRVDVLVFDEIDIGISGRVAQKTGKLMKKLSQYRQVVAITHLAQIAALADKHFQVQKEIEGNGTITKIHELDKNEKVIEVARLLSGEKVTDASIKSAKELMSD